MNFATRAQSYLDGWVGEKSAPKWLEGFVSNQLPMLVAILLILLISWRAAELTWGLIPVPDVPYHRPPTATQQASSSESAPSDDARLSKVSDLHLFGKAGAVVKPKKVDKKAPETRLNLTLHGVFVADLPENGAAIIAKGSTQKYHKVGSAVMSGVTLQAVYTDRVVLLRKGQSEVLRFPKVKNDSAPPKRRAGKSAKRTVSAKDNFGPGPRGVSRNPNLSKYRDMLKQEPLKVFEYVRFVPVKSRDGMKGYRILPQKNRELYNQLGVRPSDLVTAVNGVPLTNDKEAMKLMDQLKDASNLQVDIIRNGQSRTLSFDLN
ncbi:MAG: type II secretion system protein GspC [Chromatiales bacterium]|nr:type II secretion system protein GspC [Chromatiales bacterium]